MSTSEPPPYPGDSSPESTPSSGSDLPSYGSVPPPPTGDAGYGAVPPPPPPPPPPGAPSYAANAFSAPEAIAWGWRKFTENIGSVILAMVVIFGISIALGIVSSALTGGFNVAPTTTPPATPMELPSPTPLGILAQIVQSVVGLILTGVFAKAALEVTQGQKFDFFGAFGKVNFVRLIVASILMTVAIAVGFVLLILPGLILLFLLYLTSYAVVDDNKSPIEALKQSMRLTSANVGGALLLAILNILVMIAGVVALCVGLVVAIPVTVFATAYAFRTFNGQPVAP